MPRCLVCCLTGKLRRLRPRRTAKRSVEARRVALREKKSKSSPLQGWATTPRGYCWRYHLRPSTEGPRPIRVRRQGLQPAKQPKRSKGSGLRPKRGEDQGADSEDEGKRREAKTKAPKAKTKASEARRRPMRHLQNRRPAKEGVGERALQKPRRDHVRRTMMCEPRPDGL